MRRYGALFMARAKTLFQYRMAAAAGLVTQWVFGFIMISVLMAFYDTELRTQPMTMQQTITYTWIGQALLGLLPWNADNEMLESIRMGTVAYDLARPINLYSYWFARVFALRLVPTALRFFPMMLIATFLPSPYMLIWPDAVTVLAFLLVTAGSLMLSCSITVILQTTMLWIVRGEGILRIFPNIVTIFSGMVIPLPLFPDWMQTFLRFQPFSGLSFPLMMFSGSIRPSETWNALLLQGFWAVCFIAFGRFSMWRGLRRLTIAGG